MINPVVFIVGCPRSGTTLVRHIVSAHPQIVITPEAHWIPLWYENRKGLTPGGFVTPELVSELLAHPKFELFHLGRQELETLAGGNDSISYASFVTGILDLYGKARGKKLVGNKTPDCVRKMDTLHTLWPNARFVHVIRDGRDVALSMMNWSKVQHKKPGTFATWKHDPVSTAALWWELNVRRGRESGKLLGTDLYFELRYESLIADPEKECTRLCQFLGLSYDKTMLQFHLGFADTNVGLDKRHDWQPITPGLRNWRIQMRPENIEYFEAAAGRLLDELAYPRSFPQLEPRAEQHAAEIRNVLSKKYSKLY